MANDFLPESRTTELSGRFELYAGGCVSQVQSDPASPLLHKSSQRAEIYRSYIAMLHRALLLVDITRKGKQFYT